MFTSDICHNLFTMSYPSEDAKNKYINKYKKMLESKSVTLSLEQFLSCNSEGTQTKR